MSSLHPLPKGEKHDTENRSETQKREPSELDKQISETFERVIDQAQIKDLREIIKALAQIDSDSERQIYIEKLAKKFKIKPSAIVKDVERLFLKGENTENRKIITANFPDLVDVATDSEGKVVFLVTGLTLNVEKAVGNFIPPAKQDIPFLLPRADYVISYYAHYFGGDSSGIDLELYRDLFAYFKRFSYIGDDELRVVVFCVFLTYIADHPDIHYLPVLLFYAIPERGKTRSGKSFIYVARRGVHQVDLREANLFRYSQNLNATIFFDVKNLWRKAERNQSEDILLLRFEKGAIVSRVLYPERGPFRDMRHFNVYGPTVIASNEPIGRVLGSRCIPIAMENRPGQYEDPTPEKALALKERLTAWRASILTESLPEVEPIQELNGRLWDISKPLLQVCKLICPENFESLRAVLIKIAGQRREDRRESLEGQVMAILYELSPDVENVHEWRVETRKLLELLNKGRPEAHILTSQYLGKRLNAMGIKTKRIRGYSEIILKKTDFDTLLVQYGIIDTPTSVETLPNATTLKNEGISTGYAGRESVESEENSTQTLPIKSLNNQALRSLVESGRELGGGRGKKYLETLEVIE